MGVAGDVIAIGAQDDNDQGNWSGSAYVFERDPNGTWSQAAKLLASDGGPMQSFGVSVAVSDDVVLVGATDGHGIVDYCGAVYAYEPDPNGAWVETAKLIADDGSISDFFGCSLAL